MQVEINNKFNIGDTIYTVEGFRVIKFVVQHIVLVKGVDSDKLFYDAVPYNGKKAFQLPAQGAYGTLQEAKVLAQQNLEALIKKMKEDIESLNEEFFITETEE